MQECICGIYILYTVVPTPSLVIMKIYARGDEDLGILILSFMIFKCVGGGGVAVICYFPEQ